MCSQGAILTPSVSFRSFLVIFFKFNSWQTSATSGSNGQGGAVSEKRCLKHKQLRDCFNAVTHRSQPAGKQSYGQQSDKKKRSPAQVTTSSYNSTATLWAHLLSAAIPISPVYTAVQSQTTKHTMTLCSEASAKSEHSGFTSRRLPSCRASLSCSARQAGDREGEDTASSPDHMDDMAECDIILKEALPGGLRVSGTSMYKTTKTES